MYCTIDLIYPNGLSCSLPEDAQLEMYRSVSGLENVEIVRPAYGVEYDHIDARELKCEYCNHVRETNTTLTRMIQPLSKQNASRYVPLNHYQDTHIYLLYRDSSWQVKLTVRTRLPKLYLMLIAYVRRYNRI